MHDDCTIGQLAAAAGLTPDTLRYYEKIGLLKGVLRDTGGRRRYRARDLERLRFIRRGQKMNFTLDEIASLLQLRDAPARVRPQVRALAGRKLQDVNHHLDELTQLRGELELLLNLCAGDEGPCPILQSLDGVASNINVAAKSADDPDPAAGTAPSGRPASARRRRTAG